MKSSVAGLAFRLKKAGITSSRVNAEVILSEAIGCRIIDLYMHEITLSPEHTEFVEKMVAARIGGKPLQHITGKANFYGNDLFIREGVFIPRPETEVLVDIAIDLAHTIQLAMSSSELKILDMCTGSGNVGISLTKALTQCKITSSDISDKALRAALKNAALNSVSENMEFIKADLLDIPEEYRESFDIIVCNPPYIRSGDIDSLPDEVKRDPIEALDGGVDGMSFYRRIAEASPDFLKKGGSLVLELADDLSKDVKRFVESTGRFNSIKLFKDLNNIERVIIAHLNKN
ncbi:MAG: peptide chain release factor N(5)-glutamine methyltransferase [Candidatus Orphnella occulta]|nr:peptide chain release factor N(5)-glutamine methyltransferase [Candidatus Orphnella occulta]